MSRAALWLTSAVRAAGEPGVLQGGLEPSVGEAVPVAAHRAGSWRCTIRRPRQITHIDTCFGTHHLMFAEDANNTLWTSGGGQVVGLAEHEDVRRDRRRAEVAGLDRARSWTPTATASATPTSSRISRSIPTKDKRFGAAFYAVAPAPDGSVWGTVLGFPGAVVRLVPGSNPPETALAEVYEPPFNDPKAARASRRAAATSIATAWSGPRSRAATWPASIAASARARSTARRPPASTAPKAGRSTPSRCRSSRA